MENVLPDAETEILMLRHVVETMCADMLADRPAPLDALRQTSEKAIANLDRQVRACKTGPSKAAVTAVRDREALFWAAVEKRLAQRLGR